MQFEVDILQKRLRRVEYTRCVCTTVLWGSVLLVGVWNFASDLVDTKLMLQLGNGTLAWVMDLATAYNGANRPVESVSIIMGVPIVAVLSLLRTSGATMPTGFLYQSIVSSVIGALVLTPPIVVFCTTYGDPGYDRTRTQRFGESSYMLWVFSLVTVLLVDIAMVISATMDMRQEDRLLLYIIAYVYGQTCMGVVRGLEAQRFNGWLAEFVLFVVSTIKETLPTATALWSTANQDREQVMRIISTIAAAGCTASLITVLVTRGAPYAQSSGYQRA